MFLCICTTGKPAGGIYCSDDTHRDVDSCSISTRTGGEKLLQHANAFNSRHQPTDIRDWKRKGQHNPHAEGGIKSVKSSRTGYFDHQLPYHRLCTGKKHASECYIVEELKTCPFSSFPSNRNAIWVEIVYRQSHLPSRRRCSAVST